MRALLRRLPSIRTIFLKVAIEHAPDQKSVAFALEESAADKEDKDDKAKPKSKSNLPLNVEQDVQLIMHSENVLCDRDHYLRSACGVWAELDALHKTGRSTAAVAALAKKYILPERGGRRAGALWRGLRTVIYDPLDAGGGGLEPDAVWAAGQIERQRRASQKTMNGGDDLND